MPLKLTGFPDDSSDEECCHDEVAKESEEWECSFCEEYPYVKWIILAGTIFIGYKFMKILSK